MYVLEHVFLQSSHSAYSFVAADNPGHVEHPEDIDTFAGNMKRAFERLRSYNTNAGLLRNFADYYNPNTKLYLDWVMLGIVEENATRQLQKMYEKRIDLICCLSHSLFLLISEKKYVDSWKSRINGASKVRRTLFWFALRN
jgi:hypothetical protein